MKIETRKKLSDVIEAVRKMESEVAEKFRQLHLKLKALEQSDPNQETGR